VGKLVDEDERVGQLPLCEFSAQELTERRRIQLRSFPRNNDGNRPLLPFGMRYRDYSRFPHLGMGYQGILQVGRADPFAAGLDQVFHAVGNFQIAFRV